jgi:pilus assembly protein CpaE
VLLIDLHGQFGDAALYVSDQKPAMTLSDVCSQIERMDGAFLESCLVHVAPNFGMLAAADDPNHTVEMKPEHMETILRVARQHFDYIVLDVGRQIDAISLRALDRPTPSIQCCNWRCRTSATAAACSTSSVRSATQASARA